MTQIPKSLPSCCWTAGDERETGRTVGQVQAPPQSPTENLPELVDLVHPFVQDRHDADVAVDSLRQQTK